MKYNFDETVDRRGTGCYKYDSDHAKGLLPLWVADMDFKVAPVIRTALQKRLDHGVFGYTCVQDSYYEAVSRWFSKYHGWDGISRDNLLYTIGVVPAISAILQALCAEGDHVALLAPSYNCFYSSIRNSRCIAEESELLCRNNHFEIDWADLEEKMSRSRIFLLCNPHNPTGRLWTEEELRRIAELARKHDVIVVSDEIHCEFAFSGRAYVPYATVADGEAYLVCMSPSKAFNIAGLQMACIFSPNARFRTLVDKQINVSEICDVNPFGPVATEAAYSEEGREWLEELMTYIEGNYRYLKQRISDELPMLEVTEMEGTYLAWVNCKALLRGEISDSTKLENDIAHQKGVLFNGGLMYGEAGHDYLRINLACTRKTLEQALSLLREYAAQAASK